MPQIVHNLIAYPQFTFILLQSAMKPAIYDGAGQGTTTPPESPNPTNPTPSSNSAFSIHNSALPSSITKQHMPTYNNSTPRMKPAISDGAGPATPAPTASPNPTSPPKTPRPSDPKTPSTPTASPSITKQHMPTYNNSPVSTSLSRRARQNQILQQAVSCSAGT